MIFANRLAPRMLDHAIIVTRQRRAGTVFDRGFSSLMAESFPAGSRDQSAPLERQRLTPLHRRGENREGRGIFSRGSVSTEQFSNAYGGEKKKTKKERMRRRFIADRKSGSTAISLLENTEYGRTIYDFTVLVQRSFLIIEKFNFVGFRLTVYRSRGN